MNHDTSRRDEASDRDESSARNVRPQRDGASVHTDESSARGARPRLRDRPVRYSRGGTAHYRPQPPIEATLPSAGHAVGHETTDVRTRPIVIFGVGLLVVLGLVLVVVTGLQLALGGGTPTLSPPPAGIEDPAVAPVPTAVVVRAVPDLELRDIRGAEDKRLSSYGWVDRQAGVVSIPITRAMELLSARGLPTRADDEQRRAAEQGQQIPSDSSSGHTMEPRRP